MGQEKQGGTSMDLKQAGSFTETAKKD